MRNLGRAHHGAERQAFRDAAWQIGVRDEVPAERDQTRPWSSLWFSLTIWFSLMIPQKEITDWTKSETQPITNPS